MQHSTIRRLKEILSVKAKAAFPTYDGDFGPLQEVQKGEGRCKISEYCGFSSCSVTLPNGAALSAIQDEALLLCQSVNNVVEFVEKDFLKKPGLEDVSNQFELGQQEEHDACQIGSNVPAERCKQGYTCEGSDGSARTDYIKGVSSCVKDAVAEDKTLSHGQILTFYGGGNMYSMSFSDDDFTSSEINTPDKVNKEIHKVSKLSWDTEFKIFGFGFKSHGGTTEVGGRDSTHSAVHTTTLTSHYHRNVQVNLGDTNVGDYFDVKVKRDTDTGVVYFETLGGASSCPPEPNTDPRHKPFIDIIEQPKTPSHPDEPYMYKLRFRNGGSETFNFEVFVPFGSLRGEPQLQMLSGKCVSSVCSIFKNYAP